MREPFIDQVKGAMTRHGAELVGEARATQALAGEILEKGERARQAIVKPYRKHVTPVLKKVTEKERDAIKWYVGMRIRGKGLLPSVNWHKDAIRSNNWKAIDRSRIDGTFPYHGRIRGGTSSRSRWLE